jgi:hypothetical protein
MPAHDLRPMPLYSLLPDIFSLLPLKGTQLLQPSASADYNS